MKNLFYIIFLIALVRTVQSQDTLRSAGQTIIIHPVLHGSLVLNVGERFVFVDPYGGPERYQRYGNPDIVLITDIHGDHFDEETLLGLDLTSSRIIVPKAVFKRMDSVVKKKATILANGEVKDVMGIQIRAVPMYNLPESLESRHPKGRGNGYVLTVSEKKIYISGDTEDIPEMRQLEGIDVAFICMNLPYTMSIEQAADAVNDFEPIIVYPYHYRGSNGLSDVEMFKNLVKKAEVRLRSWYD